MRASFTFPATLFLATLTHCDRPAPITAARDTALPLVAAASASANVADAKNFVAHLVGANEVPPRDTRAEGELKLQLSADGKSLEYRIIASNIDNVFMSHIHIAPVGLNGGIVVFLFGPVAPGGGRTEGVLATGTITAANLINKLKGHPLSDLIDSIRVGHAYANVHTSNGSATPSPGNFPGGEIRGQIRTAGPQ
jgi:hypothetical protein